MYNHMPPRFSLRTLFILTTILAVFCVWIGTPAWTALRFLNAVSAQEYAKADRFFREPDDRFLADWVDRRWAFAANGNLAPWSIGQFLRGRRDVVLQANYFEFDRNASYTITIASSSSGLGSPRISPVTYGGQLIDGIRQ